MSAQSGEKPTVILVVEDEVILAMVASDILTEAGYRVIEVYNAEQALEVLNARSDIRIIFTDVNMPGSLDGYGLARIVDMKWPGIDIIVASGRTMPGPGDLPKKASFLSKPCSPSTLVRAAEGLLAHNPKPIVVHRTEVAASSAPVLPQGLKVSQPHTGIGPAGGLAQPLPEPEE